MRYSIHNARMLPLETYKPHFTAMILNWNYFVYFVDCFYFPNANYDF